MLEFPGGRYKLQLYDFQGSLLKTVTVNSDLYSLDLTSYNTGIYLVRIITPTGSFVRKIIKE